MLTNQIIIIMNNLTSKQQQIISDITEQFKLINESVKSNASFNFIDLSELKEAKRQGDIRIAEIESQNQALRLLVNDELFTMAKALNSDFKGTKLKAMVNSCGLLIQSVYSYDMQIHTCWENHSEYINNEWVSVHTAKSYKMVLGTRFSEKRHTTLASLVKDEEFKTRLTELYNASVK